VITDRRLQLSFSSISPTSHQFLLMNSTSAPPICSLRQIADLEELLC
jgi:hypothetical protein